MELKKLNINHKERRKKMKNFQKKHGLLAVAAVLLTLLAILVTIGCNNDIGSENNGYTDNFTPPPGKGAVVLNFDKQIQRTILPDRADISFFDEFDFIFTPSSGSAFTKKVAKGHDADPIVLDPDTYDLEVIGYIEISSTMQPAATSSPSVSSTPISFTITATKVVTVPVTLTVYDPVSTKTGTFNYTITKGSNVTITTADMNLTRIGTTPPATPVTTVPDYYTVDISSEINDGNNHDLTVASGYFYLDFVIENDDSGDTITFRQIVHIYQNMTSTYSFNISDDYFSSYFVGNLSYVHPQDDYPVLSENAGTNILYEGDTLELPLTTTKTITVTNSGSFGTLNWYSIYDTAHSFTGGTFTLDATSSGFFNIKKTYLLTVEGIKSGVPYSTAINVKVVDASATTIPYPTLTSTGSISGSTATFAKNAISQTITVSNAGSFTSFEWYLDGEDESVSAGTYNVDTSTVGTYKLKVVGIKGDVRHSTVITITVTP